MTKINKTQIKLIHIAKSQLKISDDDYRLLLSGYKVKTSVKLSYAQAHDLIEYFKKCGFKIMHKGAKPQRRKGKLPPGVTQLPSRQILSKIDHLREDVNWKFHDGYFRWIKKSFGIEKIKTMAEAIKVIEGLKKMLARQEKK